MKKMKLLLEVVLIKFFAFISHLLAFIFLASILIGYLTTWNSFFNKFTSDFSTSWTLTYVFGIFLIMHFAIYFKNEKERIESEQKLHEKEEQEERDLFDSFKPKNSKK